ncbi:hypothetical protein C6989_04425 [Nitrosopumilus sp. b2]|nr:hypothetical protein C6989_04425 [Nitrosopumilus sp. b2]
MKIKLYQIQRSKHSKNLEEKFLSKDEMMMSIHYNFKLVQVHYRFRKKIDVGIKKLTIAWSNYSLLN